jgi:hypothetical protein
MSARVGISITRRASVAVLVRRGRICWRRRIEREPNAAIAPALDTLLAQLPLTRRARAGACVSLGVSQSQIKRITGLPPVMRADLAARLVRENASSFFLRSSARLATTGIERDADGTTWCAALDGGLVDDVVEILRARGFRSPAFIPEPLAVAIVSAPGAHRIEDDGVVAEFTTNEHRAITQIRRVVGGVDAVDARATESFAAPLRALGEEASLYAAAFGAASLPANRALAWRPPSDPGSVRRWRRVRVASAAVLLVASVPGALVAPGVRAARDAARATRLAERRRTSAADASRVEAQLRRVTASLDRIARFESRRSALPLLLGELARALPDSTAMLAVHIDSIEVSLSVLTPRAADAVAGLAGANGVASATIVGSVIRDAGARVTLERATIRLRRKRI